MKKIVTVLLSFVILLSFSVNSFAKPLMLTYDGKVHAYSGNILQLKVNNEVVNTEIPPIILNDRSLVPARAVFEKLGAAVTWDAKTSKVLVAMNNTNVELKINNTSAKVNNKTVKLDVPAKIINDRTMIPLRFVGEQLDMVVGWHPDDNLVTIDNKQQSIKGELKGVTYTKASGRDQIVISAASYENYNIFRLSSPDRLVVDVPYAKVMQKKTIDVNSGVVKSIRYAQFDDTIARIVLDVVGQPEYSSEEKNGQLVITLGGDAPIPGDETTTGDDSTPDDGVTAGDIPTPNTGTPTGEASATTGSIKIDCSSSGSGDSVSITVDNYKNYDIFRLSDPGRIVIDIPNVKMPDSDEHKINYIGGVVKGVRYSKYGSDSLRVVLDVSGMPEFSVDEKSKKLTLNVKGASYKNIIYHNNGDRVYFSLGGAALTEGGETLKKCYTEKYSSSGKKYTITFPSNLADLGSGEMEINDSYLNSIEIERDTGSNETSIVFNAKDKFFYHVIARPDVDDTTITLLKPASKSDRLVVIDAGHGGRDPGAVYGGLNEKDLNLDIAKRLNALLKSKNVKTYMLREDDSFVGLYERSYIANNLNASLFLSIHNNATADTNFGGTMTLFFPPKSSDTGFTGKRFAQIIQNNLLAKLGTADRKIIERPNLVVLKASLMPSSLAEIAFMTNKPDRENLQKDDFRQKAAEALCQSVLQALSELK